MMTAVRPRSSGVRNSWSRDRFNVAVALIAIAGLAFRVAYVVVTRDDAVLGDGFVYHYGALDLVDGVGFYNALTGQALAGHPPGWQVLLAAPGLLGVRSWLSQQLFTCVIGALVIVMTALAARAAFGRRAGVVAAALTACYPFVWLYERELLSEPLAMLGTATTIWLAYRYRDAPSLWLAIALGAVVGAMAMTRSELLAISLLLVVPLILSTRSLQLGRRVGWLAAAGAACVLVIAPWGVYNQTRFERPVPLSTGAGAAMFTGNCPPTYEGRLLGYYELGCIAFVPEVDPDFSVADGQYRRQALEFISNNRRKALVVAAARVGRTFGVLWPNQQASFETERGTGIWVVRAGFVAYWVLLGFAIAGVVLARRRRIVVYPLLAFPLVVLLAVLPTIGSVRYRAPAEISLIILAAVALEATIARLQGRKTVAGKKTEPEPMFRPAASSG